MSNNSTVLTTAVSGTSLTLTGLISGTATVTIKDATGTALPLITVTVSGGSTNALYTTAPSAVNIQVTSAASAPQYQIFGGVPPYSVVSSNTSIATVSLSGSTYTVQGIAAGTSNVVINDSAGSKPVTISVTVGNNSALSFYTSAPSAISLGVTSNNTGTYLLGGGVPPYVASSANNSVVTATVPTSGNTNSLIITGVSPGGPIAVTVVDSNGGKVSTNVTVVGTTSSTMSVAPATVAQAFVGDTLNFVVTGGTAPYTATSNNPSLAHVNNGSNITNGTFSATMGAASSAGVIILVTDNNGNAQQITISAIAAKVPTTLSITPQAWSILSTYSGAIPALTVNGGTSPYQVFTTPATYTTITPNTTVTAGFFPSATAPTLTQLTVAGLNVTSKGNFCTGSSSPVTVTFTVIDAANAVATSNMTILPGC